MVSYGTLRFSQNGPSRGFRTMSVTSVLSPCSGFLSAATIPGISLRSGSLKASSTALLNRASLQSRRHSLRYLTLESVLDHDSAQFWARIPP